MGMRSAIGAASEYFGLVFALGFVLGALRTVLLTPRLGATRAVMLELPVMLTASWLVCGRAIRRHAVPADAGRRGAMGGLAFGLLMLAELALGRFGFRRSPAEQLARFRSADGALGLAGQVAFGLFPLVSRR